MWINEIIQIQRFELYLCFASGIFLGYFLPRLRNIKKED